MIYVKINTKNVVIDASESYMDGYIEVSEYEWPIDIFNSNGNYIYKFVNGTIELRTDNEIILDDNDDFPEEEEEEVNSIEERVSAIENAFSILLDGV